MFCDPWRREVSGTLALRVLFPVVTKDGYPAIVGRQHCGRQMLPNFQECSVLICDVLIVGRANDSLPEQIVARARDRPGAIPVSASDITQRRGGMDLERILFLAVKHSSFTTIATLSRGREIEFRRLSPFAKLQVSQ